MAVGLVVVYLVLNAVVMVAAVEHVVTDGHLFGDWTTALIASHGNNAWSWWGSRCWSSPSWRWACPASRPA